MRDIIIVGGGPAGCRLAMLLAKTWDVILLEEHDSIGEPVQCGGLVSTRAICEVTRHSSIREIKDFVLNSPSGHEIKLSSKEPKGIVINRRDYDSALAEKAEDNGAELKVNTRVLKINPKDDRVKLISRSKDGIEEMEASIIIGADGPKSIIRKSVTDKLFEILYRGAQVEGELNTSENNIVNMWIGRKIAPGFFAWKIPTEDRVRIGLCTSSDDSPMQLLKKFISNQFPEFKFVNKQSGIIPIGPLGSLVKGRIALIGDAAGQIKPLTGGGIFLGKRGAEELARSIGENGVLPETLKLYERNYKEEFNTEIARSWTLRKVINRLSDSKLDKAVKMLSDSDLIDLLEKSGDIDFPSGISPIILKKAPKLLQFAPDLMRSLR